MKEDAREQVINCLRKNKDIFAWTPQDLEGMDPGVITHHLNLDPTIRPVKQKKRHFGPEKDKIIQGEVNKLLTAGHIRKIQFQEWLSNVVLVPKPGGKWRMCIDFRDLNKACPKDYYPLPRIDQLMESTSECELLSMIDTSHGYHQIMLAPEDHKRVSFITSDGTFCYVAMLFGLKNAGATYQRLVDKIFQPQLGRNMEVYVEDMLVKSNEAHHYVEDLDETFAVLRKYRLKLNPPWEVRLRSQWRTFPRIYGDPTGYRGQARENQGHNRYGASHQYQ
ncbi:UNVERIFIED_CONTAM: Retrovirus-related Pol polyprotein from transposon opus [Sesamum latifolium]|uniref:Retrovirus-related Pol polyprotein from transposon opus n=1 Tax=Sesamum latifolium TaxID=2727402 RepID=A0AAW2TAT5_9LAMI